MVLSFLLHCKNNGYFYYQNNMCITNLQVIQYLADGLSVDAISKETGLNKRSLEKRIITLRKASMSKTCAHLVANYLRNRLIN